jgi:hypothetical protein
MSLNYENKPSWQYLKRHRGSGVDPNLPGILGMWNTVEGQPKFTQFTLYDKAEIRWPTVGLKFRGGDPNSLKGKMLRIQRGTGEVWWVTLGDAYEVDANDDDIIKYQRCTLVPGRGENSPWSEHISGPFDECKFQVYSDVWTLQELADQFYTDTEDKLKSEIEKEVNKLSKELEASQAELSSLQNNPIIQVLRFLRLF